MSDYEEYKKKHPGRGGKREGAGRPRLNAPMKLFTFRASGDIVPYLDAKEHRSEYIKSCIMKDMKSTGTGTETRTEGDSADELSKLGEVYAATRVKDIHVPLFDIKIVAGFPVPLDNDEKAQDINLLRLLCPHPEASYLIRVIGDSMIDANIYSGDIVIVDKSNRNPSEHEVAVCELNGEYTLKYFVKRGEEGWLIPANKNYPEFHITEADQFSVWGTVTYIIHKPGPLTPKGEILI